MTYAIRLNTGAHAIPTVGCECMEFIWSDGKACGAKREPCPLVECYRRGMSRREAMDDNLKQWAENMKGKP